MDKAKAARREASEAEHLAYDLNYAAWKRFVKRRK
jgi:hypothetical protein